MQKEHDIEESLFGETEMFGIENYPAFILAGILLNLTPGTDTMYILTRSVAQGREAGIVSALGISTGALIHTILAALGLSIVLANSPTLFMIVKFAGAAYLSYLGFRMLMAKEQPISFSGATTPSLRLWTIYRQGIVTNTFNPKVALFFLSFLPQFIAPQAATGPLPFLLLGITFITTGTIWCLFLACAGATITHKLRDNRAIEYILTRMSGMVFIAMGLHLALKK